VTPETWPDDRPDDRPDSSPDASPDVSPGAGLDRRPWVTAVVLVPLLWLFGVNGVDALLMAAVVLVVAVVAVALVRPGAGGTAPVWPAPRAEDSAGARREVHRLTWAFTGSSGGVSEEAVRRLRADATRRLDRRGVVLPGGVGPRAAVEGDPRQVAQARALLGEPVWALLTSAGGRMPSLADVAPGVALVEGLGVPGDAPGQHPVPSEGPTS
jgi:hypothetical protein